MQEKWIWKGCLKKRFKSKTRMKIMEMNSTILFRVKKKNHLTMLQTQAKKTFYIMTMK